MSGRSIDVKPQRPEFGPAIESDLDPLVSIDRGSPLPWTREAFAAELAHDPATLYVLRSSRQAAAFVVVRVNKPEMDIVNLAVAPDRRRSGLGRFLLSSLLDHAASQGVRTVFLEVRESNREARGLYAGAGFREFQRRPAFYREPVEDAIVMRLEMSQGQG